VISGDTQITQSVFGAALNDTRDVPNGRRAKMPSSYLEFL
jgi:hypothetical protein